MALWSTGHVRSVANEPPVGGRRVGGGSLMFINLLITRTKPRLGQVLGKEENKIKPVCKMSQFINN